MRVELLAITENSEELIARAYGICTGKPAIPLGNIQKWMGAGHLSPLEHTSATFLIEGISRTCLAQLTRHRLASYSVKSERYTDMSEARSVVPDSLVAEKQFYDALLFAQETYRKLVEKGIPREDCRFLLPQGITTELIMTANFREWGHIIELRSAPAAQWEIRDLVRLILEILILQAPHVFGDLQK